MSLMIVLLPVVRVALTTSQKLALDVWVTGIWNWSPSRGGQQSLRLLRGLRDDMRRVVVRGLLERPDAGVTFHARGWKGVQ